MLIKEDAPEQLQSRHLFSQQLSEPYPVTGEKISFNLKSFVEDFLISKWIGFVPVDMSHCHTQKISFDLKSGFIY